jgi:4-carboxymuconolactone decarboxylase
MGDTVENGRIARGLEIRREVLGADYVNNSIANASEFTKPMQDLVTDYCWGAVWARPGLDRKTRSLLNVAMLTALNHQTELGLHVQGALRNGCSDSEIQEALLQAAVYCGMPAAIDAFRTAQAALAQAAASEAPRPA